jgi:CheY-like chemotaxis protein
MHDMPRANPEVLLVDDSIDNRELYAIYLQRRGFTAVEASTGRQAIDETSRRRPDVVIMDLSLPDMDGEQAIKHIRANPETRSIPIIVVSGFDAQDIEGATWDAFLRKPCPPDSLEQEIRRLLARTAG